MTFTQVSHTSSAYRSDIEGLRALAVIPVILYHAHLSCPGGFVGVDVFFVISGYLITKIIQGESRRGRFTLMSFYHRRIRRIFPALFLVLAVSSALACVLLLPDELLNFGKSLMASAAFVSNIFFRNQTDYFDIASEQKPLLHIWSLAVEEQFYIFWPLIIIALNKYSTERKNLLLFAVILVVSLVYGEYLAHLRPKAAFFLMPSRAWELLLGALLTTSLVSDWLGRMPRRGADLASLLGVALICYAVAAYDQTTPFPGFAALAPCVGAALVIAAGAHGQTLGGRLLSLPPAAFAGRISYSLYLWHWPILVFARLYLERDLRLDEKWGAVLLAAVAAYLSWRFIEEPFRNFRVAAGDGRAWVGGGVAAGLVAASVGGVIVVQDGFPGRVQDGIREITREIVSVRSEAREFQYSPCLVRRAQLPPVEGCLLGRPPQGQDYGVILWGDSHAAQLAPALATLGRRMGFTVRQITKAGCEPLPGMRFFPEHEMRLECPDFNKGVMETILGSGPRIVIIAGWWDVYATGEVLVSPTSARPSVARSHENFVSSIKDTIEMLTRAGNRVIVVAQAPTPNGDPINCVERARLTGRDASECKAAPAARAEVDSRVRDLLRPAVNVASDVQIVFPFERLCDARECPIFTQQGHFVYMDKAHLSAAGAELVSAGLEAGIIASRRRPEAAAR